MRTPRKGDLAALSGEARQVGILTSAENVAADQRKGGEMKQLAYVLAASVAVLASAAIASAAPPGDRAITLTADVSLVWDANSCCVEEWVFHGEARIPSFGKVKLDGTYDLITHYPNDTSQSPQQSTLLGLSFVAPNGSTFSVLGSSDLFPANTPQLPGGWSVTSGSGRFSDVAGNGAYAVSGLDTDTLTISLAGSFARAP
jgi:hypothetical protein